jgi:biotin carboxyl carrier protein
MAEQVKTQSPGNIWKVLVKPGDRVREGDVLFIMEVMKMEFPHESPVAGTVTAVHVVEGQENVDGDMVAVEIVP